MTGTDEWFHADGTVCVAGHDSEARECPEGGGPVFPGTLIERMTPRPDGPALLYVGAGSQPTVWQIDADGLDLSHVPHWDLAVCRALLDLALTKIERHEHEVSTGDRRLEADRG
ncbi:hypothetical protein [Actinomadura bangladeshensis]|uniref:hypothetical protein n=1 Tax=Actinomadura bangladeshensis TaxID=453573 RepID=UPI0013D55C4D|nr:hypothetical protein [Actinomadura bangladeshensis]